MAKSKLCVFLALLCAAALLDSVTAEESLSAVEAIVEARNDEVAPELPQPEANKVLSDPLPAKSELSENPVIVPVDVGEKTDEGQGKPVGEGEAAETESAANGAEDSKTENLELAMNAEILQQPEMARLARQLKNFHNYQLYRAQKAAGLQRAANSVDELEEDDGIVPEERAVRRRKRIYKRKTNNNVRRKHHRKNVANRLNSAKRQNQRVNSVRRRNTKNGAVSRRRVKNGGNTRRTSSNKKQRKSGTSNKRRSSKNGLRKTKRKSSLKKRAKKNNNNGSPHFEEEQSVYPVHSQVNSVPRMIVILDGDKAETAIVGQAA